VRIVAGLGVAHRHNPASAPAARCVVVALNAWLALIGAAYAAPTDESKAVLIIKIAKFVRWPQAAFATPHGALQLCIVGAAEGDDTLDSLSGKKLQDRIIAVDHLSAADQPSGCQIIFISRSERDRLAQVLSFVAKSPMLTVSDMAGFVARGGMIGLITVNGRTGFEINRAASSRAGLTIGAQLMQIAAAGSQSGKR
jgi:hypothetical protein